MISKNERLRAYALRILRGRLADEAVDTPLSIDEALRRHHAFDTPDEATRHELVEFLSELRADPPDWLEAIVLPGLRPVALIHDSVYDDLPPPWTHLNTDALRSSFRPVIQAVGRIGTEESSGYIGTGFLVAENLVMTNRHVAASFAGGLVGRDIPILSGSAPFIKMGAEDGHSDDEPVFEIVRVELVHPHYDVAVVRTRGLEGRKSLHLSGMTPERAAGREIAVIGYPAPDPRNDAMVQNQVFGGRFYVKRFQPGAVRGLARRSSYGHVVRVLEHEASTLGGNSGSAIVDLATRDVLGVHFSGVYLQGNYAVPASDLGRDSVLHDAGVQFRVPHPGSSPWRDLWDASERDGFVRGTVPTKMDSSRADDLVRENNKIRVVVPIQLHVEVGSPRVESGEPVASALHGDELGGDDEGLFEIDPDYEHRPGYDEHFLTVEVPPPVVRESERYTVSQFQTLGGETETVLRYYHFSLEMHRDRRMAHWTAVNSTRDSRRRGKLSRKELGRDKWILDDRLPAKHQIQTKEFYGPLDFDRGHVVRRVDAYWGETERQARLANFDTFHYTNCTPQHPAFNQTARDGAWGRLEDHITEQAELRRSDFCLFAGPVFRKNDRVMRGVKIPASFWKIIVGVRDDGNLGAWAFLLSQRRLVLDEHEGVESFDPSGFEEHQVSVRRIESITSLRFPDVVRDADVMGDQESVAVIKLVSLQSVRLA